MLGHQHSRRPLGRPNKTLHARIQVLTDYYSNRSCQLIVVQQSQSSDKKNCTFNRCVFVFEFCNSRRIYRRSTGTTKPFQIYNRCGHFLVKKKAEINVLYCSREPVEEIVQ